MVHTRGLGSILPGTEVCQSKGNHFTPSLHVSPFNVISFCITFVCFEVWPTRPAYLSYYTFSFTFFELYFLPPWLTWNSQTHRVLPASISRMQGLNVCTIIPTFAALTRTNTICSNVSTLFFFPVLYNAYVISECAVLSCVQA